MLGEASQTCVNHGVRCANTGVLYYEAGLVSTQRLDINFPIIQRRRESKPKHYAVQAILFFLKLLSQHNQEACPSCYAKRHSINVFMLKFTELLLILYYQTNVKAYRLSSLETL